MHIGIFTDSYYPHVSGVSTSVEMLKEALQKMGHKVFIVAPNLETNKFIYDKKNEIIWLPGIKTGIYKTKLTELYSKKAMKIIQNEWKLDIIHSQSEFGVGYFSRIVSKKLNIPVVHTYHTLYEDYVHYILKGKINNILKKLVIKLTRYYCDKKCDELIVPTNKIKELFINKYGIKRNIHVIPSGIDLIRFNYSKKMINDINKLKKKYHIKDNDFIIGSVGRIAEEKSFDKIIINLKELIKVNKNIKFMLVGDGPDIDNLKQLAKDLNVNKNMIFTGLVNYDDISLYYHLFDVMVTFSKSETQGLTVIEALAASKPCICINDASFREMVQNNYNGYLFNTDKEFQNNIYELINNKELYKIMCKNAKNSTYIYSKEVFASNILKIYNAAIQNKRAK